MIGRKEIRARRLAALEERRVLAGELAEFEARSRLGPLIGAGAAEGAEAIKRRMGKVDERLAVLAEVRDDPEDPTAGQKRLVAEEALSKVLPPYRLERFETGTEHGGECRYIEIRLEWHRSDPYDIFADGD